MSTFFGIEVQGSDEFLNHGAACLDKSNKTESSLLGIFRTIRTEDVIFLKSFSPQTGISVKAIGVVLPGYPSENSKEICMPVEWYWKGNNLIEIYGETYNHCSDYLYEEHNIWIQRQLIDLMPNRYKLPEEW